jgi:alpha-tubulin suppressor-like RCC1 family protein
MPSKVQMLSDIKKVACGGNHTLALHKEGFVFGWGSNSSLQLSHENEFAAVGNPLLAVFSPLKIDKEMNSTVATDIAAGNDFSMFVARNRLNNETEVYGCGYNMHGELGAGNLSHIQDVIKIESLSNYKIKTDEGEKDVRVTQIACGSNHCLALLNVGAVIEWGGNEFGQLGNRKRVFSENPIIMKDFADENIYKVCCGYENSGVIAEYNEAREQEKLKKKNEKPAEKK